MGSAVLMLSSPSSLDTASDHPTPSAILRWAYQTTAYQRRTPVLVLPHGVTLTPTFFARLVTVFSESMEGVRDDSTELPTRLAIELCAHRSGIWTLVGLAGLADNIRLRQAREEMMRASRITPSSITRRLLPSRPATNVDTLLIAVAEEGTELPGWAQSLKLAIEPGSH